MSRKMKLFSRKSAAPGVSEPSALKHMEIADAKVRYNKQKKFYNYFSSF